MLRAYEHRRVTLVALLATALSIAFPSVCRAQSSRRQMELIRNLPDNAHVLYALGDLNGDGFVDRRDLAILRDIVAKPSGRCPPPRDAQRPATSISIASSTPATSMSSPDG